MDNSKRFFYNSLLIISFIIFNWFIFRGKEIQIIYSFYALIVMTFLSFSHKLKFLEYGKLKVELTEKIQEANDIIAIMNEYMKSLLQITYKSASNIGRAADSEKEFLFLTEIADELLKKSNNEHDPEILEIRTHAFYLLITDGVRDHDLTKHLFQSNDTYTYTTIPHPDEVDKFLLNNEDYKAITSNYRLKYNKYIKEIK